MEIFTLENPKFNRNFIGEWGLGHGNQFFPRKYISELNAAFELMET